MLIKIAIEAAKQSQSLSSVRGVYVEVDDGTRLFVRDWGAGNTGGHFVSANSHLMIGADTNVSGYAVGGKGMRK